MFIATLCVCYVRNEARNEEDFVPTIYRVDQDRTGRFLGFNSQDAFNASINAPDLIFSHRKQNLSLRS